MKNPNSYYTLKGYSLLETPEITTAMEDYLEMLCRLEQESEPLRIGSISSILHVRPSSASKMITLLKERNLVTFEKYGTIFLTEKGRLLGEYFLFRHEILHRFFCYMNQTENELELVEKVEHFIDRCTVYHLSDFLDSVK